MVRQTFVLRVMIASPGDLHATREAIFASIESFNRTDAEVFGYTLQNRSWESSGVASSGRFAQDELNVQLVSRADVLVGMFKDKFGTPTENYRSGTQEEIEEFYKQGGRPSVFFRSDLPDQPESDQLQSVLIYRNYLFAQKFLVGSYIPAPPNHVDYELVIKVLEAIKLQASRLVADSSLPMADKRKIESSLNNLDHPSARTIQTDVDDSNHPRPAKYDLESVTSGLFATLDRPPSESDSVNYIAMQDIVDERMITKLFRSTDEKDYIFSTPILPFQFERRVDSGYLKFFPNAEGTEWFLMNVSRYDLVLHHYGVRYFGESVAMGGYPWAHNHIQEMFQHRLLRPRAFFRIKVPDRVPTENQQSRPIMLAYYQLFDSYYRELLRA